MAKKYRRKRKKSTGLGRSLLILLIVLIIFFGSGTDQWVKEQAERFGITYDDITLPDLEKYLQFPEKWSDLLSKIPGWDEFMAWQNQGRQDDDHKPVQGKMQVHFLDVGQGSACLIESEGHYMLVDGGPPDHSSFVVAYLKSHGVEQLDYVIASHYDADHISGLVGVLNVFPVKAFIGPDYTSNTKIYNSLWTKVKANGSEVIYPKAGEKYILGEAELTIVSPINYDYEDGNNDSVGIRLVHGGCSFLIMGDAEAESEIDVCNAGIRLKSDVYVANHHGSSSSSTETLLRAADPSVAVISVGKDNKYGHPTAQTLKRLKALDVQLYRTDIQGTLIAVSDGSRIQWDQKPCNDFTPGKK